MSSRRSSDYYQLHVFVMLIPSSSEPEHTWLSCWALSRFGPLNCRSRHMLQV